MPYFVICCSVVKNAVCPSVAVSVLRLPSLGADVVMLSKER